MAPSHPGLPLPTGKPAVARPTRVFRCGAWLNDTKSTPHVPVPAVSRADPLVADCFFSIMGAMDGIGKLGTSQSKRLYALRKLKPGDAVTVTPHGHTFIR